MSLLFLKKISRVFCGSTSLRVVKSRKSPTESALSSSTCMG
ncbi:unnamed protein product [Brassica oleracea var. botrytis]